MTRNHWGSPVSFPCPVPKCTDFYHSSSGLESHLRTEHSFLSQRERSLLSEQVRRQLGWPSRSSHRREEEEQAWKDAVVPQIYRRLGVTMLDSNAPDVKESEILPSAVAPAPKPVPRARSARKRRRPS